MSLSSFVAGAPVSGLAFTVNVYSPAVVGVPEILPVDLPSSRPSGRLVPLVSVHTMDEVESVFRVTVYVVSATASGSGEVVVIVMLAPTLMQPSSLGEP